MKILHVPSGAGLLLVGSGIYWVLSSRLIESPTALAPGLFRDAVYGTVGLLVVGLLCIFAGFPSFARDVRRLRAVLMRSNGWVFTLPIVLASMDLELTVAGLSTGRAVELNPFVSAATAAGPIPTLLFLLSYIALSEGLGLLMLGVGGRFYGPSSNLRFLPYALVCGAAAFGPFSNLALITLGSIIPLAGYLSGFAGSSLLSFGVFSRLKQ